MRLHKYHSWNEYYSNHKLSIANIILHWQYLVKIILSRPKSLMEIGCGPADHSVFIKKLLPKTKIYLVDNDHVLLNRIKMAYKSKIADTFTLDVVYGNEANFKQLPHVDIVISQGLMEHFNDSEFVKVINNFRYITKRMIFSVPSDQYPTHDFGNEILRDNKKLIWLLHHVRSIDFKVDYYLDIGLRTKMKAIRMNKRSIFKILFYLLFGSNHILVAINYQE